MLEHSCKWISVFCNFIRCILGGHLTWCHHFLKPKLSCMLSEEKSLQCSGFFLPSVCIVSRPVVWNICIIWVFWHRWVILYPDVHSKVKGVFLLVLYAVLRTDWKFPNVCTVQQNREHTWDVFCLIVKCGSCIVFINPWHFQIHKDAAYFPFKVPRFCSLLRMW